MEYYDAEVDCQDEAVYQAVYRESFMVPVDLVGLAIGTEGANMNKSRQIKGVVDVQKKKKAGGYSFTVFGESPEAIKKARSVLELRQEDYTIPKHLAGQVIGKFGQAIEGVINKSLVNRISVQDENDDVIFNIIGPPEAIENAKFLLNNKLEEILNTDESFFTETFMVPLDLIGLSIGTKGDNIKKSKRISGVFSVKYEKQQDSCRFRILGETLEAVKKARSILELSQHAYRVPKHYIAGPVIGKFEQAIEEVINETIIKTITKHKKNDDVILTIIGPPEAIDSAKCLLKYKLAKTEGTNFKRKNEYSTKKTGRYKTSEKDGYSSEVNDGHSTDEINGYSIRTVEKDVYRTEEKNGHNTEKKDKYSTVENEGYSRLENERCNTVEKDEDMTEETGGYRTAVKDGYMTEETGGYRTAVKDGYMTEETGGYRTAVKDGYMTEETGGYRTAVKDGYMTEETGGYRTAVKDGYMTEETGGYRTAVKDGYMTEETGGYRTAVKDGYMTEETGGYRTAVKDGYMTEETGGYRTAVKDGYMTEETGGYRTAVKDGYMTEETGGYRTAVKDGFRTEEKNEHSTEVKDKYSTDEIHRYRTEEMGGCSNIETGAFSTVEEEIDLVRKEKNRVKEDSESTFIVNHMQRVHEGQNPLCTGSDIRSRQPTYTDLPMPIVDSAVQSDPSFALDTQCEVKNICSKKKQTQLTKVKMQDNCLGKYIEAVIQVKGVNAGYNADTRPACYDEQGTCMSLDSPNISNEKEEISFERCNGNEMNRRDQEQSLESHHTKDSWEMWDSDEEPSLSTE